MTTKPQTILLSRAKFVRLGLQAMREVNPNWTTDDWDLQFEDLMESWNRIVMQRYKDEGRTNNRGAAQVLCSEPKQPRYEIYS